MHYFRWGGTKENLKILKSTGHPLVMKLKRHLQGRFSNSDIIEFSQTRNSGLKRVAPNLTHT